MSAKYEEYEGGDFTADEREQFLGIEDKRKKRVRVKNFLLGFVIAFFVAVAGFLLTLAFFKVDTIIVEGSERYDYGSIVEKSGITEDDLIFMVSNDNVRKTLYESFPFIKDVKLIREYPSTIIIEIEEEIPKFYFEFRDEYFVVGSKMKVLERYTDYNKMLSVYDSLVPVILPTIKTAIVSFDVEFLSEKESKHVLDAISLLYDSKMLEHVTVIDLSLRFEMNLKYEDRIQIEFGGVKDFADKLDFAYGIIKTYSQNASGVIYVENIVKAYALIEDE